MLRSSIDQRPLVVACLLGVLGLGTTACEASLDEDGAELDIEQDVFEGDG